MGRPILVFAVVALAVTALAAVSYAQCAAPTASVTTTCVQAQACPQPCPAPCPTCPPLEKQKWTANLGSVSGVPCPGASGNVDFQLNSQGTELRYWVHVRNVNNVSNAQIHLISQGGSACDVAAAPVVANLWNGPAREGCSTGRLARGKISACDLTGPLAGQPLSALVIALTNCTAVVSVGTCQNPCGEIAGLAGPTTGQTLACYTPESMACTGLSQACPPPCPTVACAPAVTCAPAVSCAPACPPAPVACAPACPPAPAPQACAPCPTQNCVSTGTACVPIAMTTPDLQPYWKQRA